MIPGREHYVPFLHTVAAFSFGHLDSRGVARNLLESACTSTTASAFESEAGQSLEPCVWFLHGWHAKRAALVSSVLADTVVD